MLVRNSENLKSEVLYNLRTEYLTAISTSVISLEDELGIQASYMLDELLRNNLTTHVYDAFKVLETEQSISTTFDYIKVVPNCTLNLCSADNSLYQADPIAINTYDPKIKETYTTYTGINVCNIPCLTAPIPKGSIYYEYSATPGVTVLTLSNTGFYVNVDMTKLIQVQHTMSTFYKPLLKINNEYTHFMNILDYFWKLFDELPSLNRMYKACPSIINYIKEETRQNLFRTNANTIDPSIKGLLPSDDVSVALGRNKLRRN